MLFFAAVAALAVAANAQSIRVSPAIIGSTAAGTEQVFALGAGGSVHHPHHQVLSTPVVHHHKVVAPVHHHKVVAAAPVTYTVAQPQAYTVAHPQTYTVAHPQTYTIAQPTIYKKIVAQPLVAAHHIAQPFAHHVAQPIVKVQNFEAPQIVKVAHHHQPLKVQEEQYEIQPYTFSFDAEDEYQNKHGRQEVKDANGVVTGQYSVANADGTTRIVSYVADHEGFRASVKTNEPGTLTSAPAGVHIESSAAVPARR